MVPFRLSDMVDIQPIRRCEVKQKPRSHRRLDHRGHIRICTARLVGSRARYDAAGAGFDVMRYAWAEVDLDAIRHNVGVVRQTVAPAAVWAVVKADAYGHGVAAVSKAALEAG